MGNSIDDLARSTFYSPTQTAATAPTSNHLSTPKTTAKRPRATSDPHRNDPALSRNQSEPVYHKKRKSKKKHRRKPKKDRKKEYRRRKDSTASNISHTSMASTKSENDTKYSRYVVDQLVASGIGTEKECIHASAITTRYWEINDVRQKLIKIKARKHRKPKIPQSTCSSAKSRSPSPKLEPLDPSTLNSNGSFEEEPIPEPAIHQQLEMNIPKRATFQNDVQQTDMLQTDGHQMTNSRILRLIDMVNLTPDIQPDSSQSPKLTSTLPSPQGANTAQSKTTSPKAPRIFSMPPMTSPMNSNSASFSDAQNYVILNRQSMSKTLGYDLYDDMKVFDEMSCFDRETSKSMSYNPLADSPHAYVPKQAGPKPLKFELKNSISATKPTYHIEKTKQLQQQIRESIESTLSEPQYKIAVNEMNISGQQQLDKKSVYLVKEPPKLPAKPDHIMYYDDSTSNNEYVVCCTGHEMFGSGYESGVYLYDVNELLLELVCKYPDDLWPNSMGMAVDHEQHKVHLFGGKGLFGQWLILNMKAKIWDIRKDLSKYKIPFTFTFNNPKCLIIDGSLHVYSKGRFIRYNKRKHRFTELPAIEPINGYFVEHIEHMFYVKSQRRIYVIGGRDESTGDNPVYFEDIWYCEHSKTFHEYKWHRFGVQLPYHEETGNQKNKYNACLGFEHLIFIFYHQKQKVWCIDLLKEKRFICDKLVNIEHAEYCQFVRTKANITHALCMDHNGPIHTVLQLNDILTSTPGLS